MNFRAFIRFFPLVLVLLLLATKAEAQETQKGVPSPAITKSHEDYRPQEIFISGFVVKDNGTPPVGADIELECRGAVTRESTVGANGRFSFRLGDSNRFGQQYQDVSQDTPDPFGRDGGSSPFDIGPSFVTTRVQKMPGDSSLAGCTLRAALSGYKSSYIEMAGVSLSMLTDIGTLVLYPSEKIKGSTTSATSLLAPKSARKTMEKAKAALRKDKPGDAEKYLQSATALYPKYGEAWFLLGKLYQNQQRIPEARDAYTKAIAIDGLYVYPHIWLAWISAAEHKWQDVAELTDKALALDPISFPEAHYLSAMAGLNLKNPGRAEKSALQTERLDSTHRYPKVHLILASMFAGKSDMVGSIEELRKYLRFGPRGAQALQDYGDEPYMSSAWEKAGEAERREIALRAGLNVRQILAEVFLGAGMDDQARDELSAYLENRDISKMSTRVRNLYQRLYGTKIDATAAVAVREKAALPKEKPIDYLHDPVRDLPDFEQATDQAPMKDILEAVGANVSRLFADLLNVSAVEKVQLEKIDGKASADAGRKYEYLYLCLGAIEKHDLLFDEYRSDAQGREIRQLGLEEGYMLTSGFMSAPLIFHPMHQDGNVFRLLGYQKLRGRNTIVVAFAQIPGKCRLSGQFQVGTNRQETYKQGIAWIDAENYQILRITTDLLQPLPQLGLEKLKTQIDFDEVRFPQITQKFWLPVQVMVGVNWNGRVLRNTHAYSDFRLFDVATSQRIDSPK